MKNIIFTENDVGSGVGPNADVVGRKAYGLFLIPVPWRLPLVVLKAEVYAEWAGQNSKIKQKRILETAAIAIEGEIKDWSENWPRGIILRSSAVKETLIDRGAYASFELPADYSIESISKVIHSIFNDFSESQADGSFAIAVQPLISKKYLGHCSNEKRVSKTINQWEWSMEDGSSESGRFNSQRSVPPDKFSTLAVNDHKKLLNLLRKVGRWCTELGRGPAHMEWCWDNENLWLLQMDFEDESPDNGANPRELIRDEDVSPPGTVSTGSYVQEITFDGRKYGWGKVDVVTEFIAVRDDPYAKLFKISGADFKKAIENKSLFVDQIRQITHDRTVCRTACNNTSIAKHNLPRTDTCSAEKAVEFLEDTLKKLVKQGATPDEICFIMHKFIPARAAAWALAEPEKQIVRIDSLWGVPDGLQYYPHDSFQVDVKLKKTLSVRNRYKPFFIQELTDGEWKQVAVGRRYVRSQSVHSNDLMEIAEQTQKLATNRGAAVQVMWFCDISKNAGIGRNLPWYMEPAGPLKNPKSVAPKKSRFIVRNLDDIARAETEAVNQILLLEPEAQLVRDDDFLDNVAALAKRKNFPIEFQGSTLGHAYYGLQREGIAVYPTDEPKYERTRGRKTFFKLVRDDIPARIAQAGEKVVLAKIPKSEARSALLVKLFEEAIELKEAQAPDDVLAELADVLEVVRSLALATGLEWEGVEEAAAKKRQERGSFQDGVVLMETSWSDENKKIPVTPRLISLKALAKVEQEPGRAKVAFPCLFTGRGVNVVLPSGKEIHLALTANGIYVYENARSEDGDQLEFTFPSKEMK